MKSFIAFFIATIFFGVSNPVISQLTQQGSKLIGTGAVDPANQGYSVGLSADGNTAIFGGEGDNANVGAAWVFTRTGGVWSQQGNKLVGTGATGNALQGVTVALSGDGNTAILGGFGDNSNQGAAWIFTRTGGVWSQQGNKLVGTGGVGTPFQGYSVTLSLDGNTAIVGGYTDNTNIGAVWVFTRTGGVWSQQGSKLVGTGAQGIANQGSSVSLSADGNTVLVGGQSDNTAIGAAWVFTRSTGAWTQQGSKLVGTGTGGVGSTHQGESVALSADGGRDEYGDRRRICRQLGDRRSVGVYTFRRSLDTTRKQTSRHRFYRRRASGVLGFHFIRWQ